MQNRVLIVEDDVVSLLNLKKVLQVGGFEVTTANNGVEALKVLETTNVDAILTDWMMPEMDGIELVRRVRVGIKDSPFIAIVTAIESEDARIRALESGADDYLGKPYKATEIHDILRRGLQRDSSIDAPPIRSQVPTPASGNLMALGIAASTGGPPSVRAVVQAFGLLPDVAVFIVLHGPAWMLESYGNRLQEVTPMKIVLGRHGDDIRPGTIYLAPGDFHMTVSHDGRSLQLDHGPLENFIRPAADPLFRSLARAFKERCVAVILTGMGKDGTLGAGYVAASGGTVIAEDPTTATIPSMPKNVIEVRIASRVEPLQRVGRAIEEELVKLASHCCA